MSENWAEPTQSPLALDGWLEFNRRKWRLEPMRVRLSESGKQLPALAVVLYLDQRGRIVHPPLNPYLPVSFSPTPTRLTPRLHRQWLRVSGLLAEEFQKRGVRNAVSLPPEVVDVREWQWRGFLAEVRYTLLTDLPHPMDQADNDVRRQASRAREAGYRCGRAQASDSEAIVACLADTGARQGFSYQLTPADLQLGVELMGPDCFRVYACRDPNGEVVSVRIILSAPGACAIDWVVATGIGALNSGATQYLLTRVLDDLAGDGVREFDFEGANLPAVSAAKATWGAKFVPFYSLRQLTSRSLAAIGVNAWRRRRERPK